MTGFSQTLDGIQMTVFLQVTSPSDEDIQMAALLEDDGLVPNT